jgi:hypothetical protein
MQIFQLSTLVGLVLATIALASPLATRDVASCETQTAADQVSCTTACGSDAACITSWYVDSSLVL